eukprot:scaffold2332_cov105-Pinguiococcus_pyrenoidosus.AAC.1
MCLLFSPCAGRAFYARMYDCGKAQRLGRVLALSFLRPHVEMQHGKRAARCSGPRAATAGRASLPFRWDPMIVVGK